MTKSNRSSLTCAVSTPLASLSRAARASSKPTGESVVAQGQVLQLRQPAQLLRDLACKYPIEPNKKKTFKKTHDKKRQRNAMHEVVVVARTARVGNTDVGGEGRTWGYVVVGIAGSEG